MEGFQVLRTPSAHKPESHNSCMPNVRRLPPLPRIARWLLVLAACVLPWVAGGAAETAGGGTTRTIIFFGDSLTAGYGLENPTGEAYPAVIQRKIDADHLAWRVVNAGLSGETSAGGLRRVDWILRQPVDIFFLALGGNDGLRGIDPAVTQRNLDGIIERVRTRYPAAMIIVAGMQMPPGMGEDYTREFRAVFPAVAQKEHVLRLPFLLEGVAGRPDLNQSDGIHPTAAGHRLVADNVWKVLHPLL
jgi:acyl-CoA thioesterase-1